MTTLRLRSGALLVLFGGLALLSKHRHAGNLPLPGILWLSKSSRGGSLRCDCLVSRRAYRRGPGSRGIPLAICSKDLPVSNDTESQAACEVLSRDSHFPANGGVTTARRRFIAAGVLLIFLVAPFVWLTGFGTLFERAAVGFGILWLALVTAVAGFGLLIYGLVAKRAVNEADT